MLHHFTDATCAEIGQDLVEAPAAMTEGVNVGPVAQGDDAVDHRRKIGSVRLQAVEQILGIVRHIAEAVGRRADEKVPAFGERAGVESVHHAQIDLMPGALQRLLHFLRDHLGGTGHRANENGE